MKSITLEDTFNDYGLSVWRHVENDDDMWGYISDEGRIQAEQMISKSKIVFKKCNSAFISTVVYKTARDNLKTKHYIRIGEECPICCEPIFHKRNAYLTNCGHAFHYKCIMDYEYKSSLSGNPDIKCPICRQHMGYYPELKNKFMHSCTHLDKLEDINNTLHMTNPTICVSCKKVQGFNEKCNKCMQYILCYRVYPSVYYPKI